MIAQVKGNVKYLPTHAGTPEAQLQRGRVQWDLGKGHLVVAVSQPDCDGVGQENFLATVELEVYLQGDDCRSVNHLHTGLYSCLSHCVPLLILTPDVTVVSQYLAERVEVWFI
jgi:hypothetical protein